MRVTCPHCGTKATITSRHEISSHVAELYCQCMNTAECGASFVASLAFKKNINPPAKSVQELAAAVLRNLPSHERRELLQTDLFC